jgi:hypothetical protein
MTRWWSKGGGGGRGCIPVVTFITIVHRHIICAWHRRINGKRLILVGRRSSFAFVCERVKCLACVGIRGRINGKCMLRGRCKRICPVDISKSIVSHSSCLLTERSGIRERISGSHRCRCRRCSCRGRKWILEANICGA